MRIFLIYLAILSTVCAGCDQSSKPPKATPTPSTATQNIPSPDQKENVSEPLASPGRARSASGGVGASKDPALSSPHGPPHIIVAFGDSLTAGLGVASHEAYPAQLEARLREAGYPYRVVNAGVSGDTTAGGIRRLDWIIKTKPAIVILELGANDGLRGIPLNEVRGNLNQMIQSLQNKGIQVVLVGMKLPPNYGPLYTRGFSNLYSELAREYDIPFIPFFLEGVAARPELNQEDGLHPTVAGYSRVVDNVLPVLLPLLTPILP